MAKQLGSYLFNAGTVSGFLGAAVFAVLPIVAPPLPLLTGLVGLILGASLVSA